MTRNPLHGRLVRLRARHRDDAASVSAWFVDTDVIQFQGVRYPLSFADALVRSSGEMAPRYAHARFAVESLASGAVVGDVALHVETPEDRCGWLSITVAPEARGHGYGVDAMRTVCRFGFEMMNLQRIELTVDSDNDRARHVYERVGFRVEGALREASYTMGRYVDSTFMGLLRGELVEEAA